LESLLKPVGL